MRFLPRFFIAAFAFIALQALPQSAANSEPVTLKFESPAFAANSPIPGTFTCEGEDISPPLSWSGVPEGTKSFALIVDDPDAPDPAAPKRTWVHWVLYNIPATVTNLPQGVNPSSVGMSEGSNDWGGSDYRGPCPPIGKHRYFFKLYALSSVFASHQPLTKQQLENSMIGYTLLQATLMGTYEHSKR